MIKNNKLKAVLSSLVILLPAFFGIVFWNKLPNTMLTHWGADGNADGFSSKAIAVFGLPIIMLVLHWFCLIVTSFDIKQKNQSKKAIGMIFGIVPFISLFVNAQVYCIALGKKFNPLQLMPLMFAVMFIFMGNYLPKVKPNRTLGIKISFTLNNEENWNKTHRFTGKIWVIGGLILLISVFLPDKFIIPIACAVILFLVSAPVVYSYCIYRKHLKAGISYTSAPKSKKKKTVIVINAVLVSLILAGLAALMFTGNIEYSFNENIFSIDADYWSDLEIDCEKIDSAEYRENFDFGVRTNGLGSARLAMGNFYNDEFGDYTLYSYAKNHSCVVLKTDGNILVINGRNQEETKELYNTVSEKIQK